MDKSEEAKKQEAFENDQPQEPRTDNTELSDEDLDEVAGGRRPLPLNPQPLPPGSDF